MINNIVFVRELNSILKYQSNKNENSFYKTYKMFNGEENRQVRFSSHGTYLRFWIEQEYDPAFGINISIAFTESGTPTNDCHIDNTTNEPYKDCRPCLINQELTSNPCKPRKVPNYNQKKRHFSVTQYVYNCQNFDGNEIELLANAINNASINGEYIDPFKGVEGKEAILVILEPIEESKNYNKQNINCNRNMKNNRIRLTESQLHNIIRKCVNEAVNELDPRTYTNYAKGREAQAYGERPLSAAQQRIGPSQSDLWHKSDEGHDAAVKSWNDIYGIEDYDHGGDDYIKTKRRMVSPYNDRSTHIVNTETIKYSPVYDDYEYLTNTSNCKWTLKPYRHTHRAGDDGSKYIEVERYYKPEEDKMVSWAHKGIEGIDNRHCADQRAIGKRSADNWSENKGANDEGLKVARQMATGTGRYVKGKGWE